MHTKNISKYLRIILTLKSTISTRKERGFVVVHQAKSRSDAQTFLRQGGEFFQTSSVNLDAWDPSCDGCDRPSTSDRGGNGSSGGGTAEKGPCSVTGVRAGLGRITGVPIWPLSRCVSRAGKVGVPGPP
jgi:hypothetical protein